MTSRSSTSSRAGAEARAPFLPYAAVLAVLALMPWPAGANRDWLWPVFAVATFALAWGHAAMVVSGRWRLGRGVAGARVFLGLLVAWVAFAVVQAVVGGIAPAGTLADADATTREALRQACWATIAWLVIATVDSRRRLLGLLAVLFAVGVAQAALGAFMTLSGIEWGAFGEKAINRGVATGTFVNRNHLAGYLALTGALGLGLLVAQFDDSEAGGWRGRLRGWLRWLLGPGAWTRVALAVLVVGLILTRSRMGNLAFFAAIAAAGVVALLLVRPMPRQLLVLVVSILAIDALLLGSWFGVEQVAQRVAATTVVRSEGPAAADSDAERVDVSRATLQLWREHPHAGVGAGGFRAGFPAVKPASVSLFYDHAHDDWAQLLAERGWIGLLLWLVLAGSAVAAALRALRRAHDTRSRGVAVGCLAALLAAGLHAFVDFNGQVPAYAAAAFAVMAAAVLSAVLRPRAARIAGKKVEGPTLFTNFSGNSGT